MEDALNATDKEGRLGGLSFEDSYAGRNYLNFLALQYEMLKIFTNEKHTFGTFLII